MTKYNIDTNYSIYGEDGTFLDVKHGSDIDLIVLEDDRENRITITVQQIPSIIEVLDRMHWENTPKQDSQKQDSQLSESIETIKEGREKYNDIPF